MKRRDSLKLINGLIFGIGLSSFRKSWMPDGLMSEQESILDFAKRQTAEDLHQYAMSINAKRYLSGWMGMMNANDFKNHYKGKLSSLSLIKKKMDPNNIFRSWFSDKFLSSL
jgi:hypothetical protein